MSCSLLRNDSGRCNHWEWFTGYAWCYMIQLGGTPGW
jgi:hypothetical protein